MANKDDKPKGILRKTTSKLKKGTNRSATFDEMNVISTLHPKGKDYGHDQISESKTPFNYDYKDGPSTSSPTFTPMELAAKIKSFSSTVPTVVEQREKEDRLAQSSEKESPEERQKRIEFEKKRKQHYNEFQAVKSIEKDETQAHSSKK